MNNGSKSPIAAAIVPGGVITVQHIHELTGVDFFSSDPREWDIARLSARSHIEREFERMHGYRTYITNHDDGLRIIEADETVSEVGSNIRRAFRTMRKAGEVASTTAANAQLTSQTDRAQLNDIAQQVANITSVGTSRTVVRDLCSGSARYEASIRERLEREARIAREMAARADRGGSSI